jgi:nitrate/nitrite transporter NarK
VPEPRTRWLALLVLIFAGETIFALPFHVARFFRPTLLAVYELDNAGLGDVFAVYGIVALLAYFPGGPIADRFSPRRLMALSLFATAAGGLLIVLWPDARVLVFVYGLWGASTILLFWAAMIRATRAWGGAGKQGLAFGFLDGGRGLVAAAMASVGVLLLRESFALVVWFYCAMTLLAGLACWFLLDDPPAIEAMPRARHDVLATLRKPEVWLQAMIVVAAYCGYKALDNVGVYAVDAMGMNEAEAAAFTARCAWLRPPAAVLAGVLADRLRARPIVTLSFGLLALASALLGLLAPSEGLRWGMIVGNLVVAFVAVYALRGVYFVLLAETRVPTATTGTAVGIISVIGFAPDIFYASLAGRILDGHPGLRGHQHHFWLLAGIAGLGVVASLLLSRLSRREYPARVADRSAPPTRAASDPSGSDQPCPARRSSDSTPPSGA